MLGLMQDWPLRVSAIIDHAAKYHGGRAVVSRSVEGPVTRTNWAGVRAEALKLAQALTRLGVAPGEVIGCMAWNTARHMEVWYGVPGAGAVLHSLNPRLAREQLLYIINHAGDRWLFCDLDLVAILEGLAADLPQVRGYVVMTDRAHMPETSLPNVFCYEEIVGSETGDAPWVEVDERAACGICYTSGTTGEPKGAVYAHRSNVIHAMVMIQPDMLGLSCTDVLMPVVPMFHANGWSTAFTAPMAGTSMVLPGRQLDPASLYEMLGHGVTITAAVPTIWLMLLSHLRDNELTLPDLNRVAIGGSSCPRAVIETFQNDYGVRVLHAWGMTETSPLGTLCSFKPEIAAPGTYIALGEQGVSDGYEAIRNRVGTVRCLCVDDDPGVGPGDDHGSAEVHQRHEQGLREGGQGPGQGNDPGSGPVGAQGSPPRRDRSLGAGGPGRRSAAGWSSRTPPAAAPGPLPVARRRGPFRYPLRRAAGAPLG